MGEFFRQLVKTSIDDMGLTQQEVANRANMTQPQLNAYLNGKKKSITDDTVEDLCDALGIDLNRLKD